MRDGLTDDEWNVLRTPLGEVRGNREFIAAIIQIYGARVQFIRAENLKFKPSPHKRLVGMVIRDDLGTHGIVNHADGKRYDSKSEFRKATRRAGCYEVGNDVKANEVNWKPPIERGIKGDYNVKEALKQALHQHGVK